MKNFILIIFLSANLFAIAQSKGAYIKLNQEKVEYGTIQKNSDGIRKVEIINTGDQPLVITNCKGSCGCTVPTCPQEPIPPGNSAFITIKYDTKRIGHFNKTVTIKSNAINHTIYLKIEGVVVE